MYSRYLQNQPSPASRGTQRYSDKSRSPYSQSSQVAPPNRSGLSEHSPGGTVTADERMALEYMDSLAHDFQPSFIETMKNQIYPLHNYKVIAAFKVYKVDRNRESLIQNLIHLHTQIENRRSKISSSQSHQGLPSRELNRSLKSSGHLSSEKISPYRQTQTSPSYQQDTSLDLDSIRDQLGIQQRSQEQIQRRMLAYVGRDGLTRQTFKICFKICLPMSGNDTSRVPQYIKSIQDLFFLFDRNSDGVVDRREMQKGLNMLFNRDLETSFMSHEAPAGESPFRGSTKPDEVQKMFDQMRQKGKDYLVLRDVELFISRLLPPPDQRRAISMALQSFRVADTNRDGRISEEEFVDWYNSPDFRKIKVLMGKEEASPSPGRSQSSKLLTSPGQPQRYEMQHPHSQSQQSPSPPSKSSAKPSASFQESPSINKESLASEASPEEATQISPGHGTIKEEPIEAEVSSTNSPSLTIESRKRGSGTARSHNFSPQKKQNITPGQHLVRDNIVQMSSMGKESGRNRGVIPQVQEEEIKESPSATFTSEKTETVGGGVKTGGSMGGGNLMKNKLKTDKAGARPKYTEDETPQTNRSVRTQFSEEDLEQMISSKNLAALTKGPYKTAPHLHRNIYLLQRETTIGSLSKGFIQKSFNKTVEENPLISDAMEEVEQKRLNSGLNTVNFIDMAREMKRMIDTIEEGLKKKEFIDLVFKHYQNQDMTRAQRKLRRKTLSQIFEDLDEDMSDTVDLEELAQGLTILCGGSVRDKIEGAFILFDYNNTETLDFEEMTSMMNMVYKVLFSNRKGFEKVSRVSPGELADIVTQKCFNELDIHPSGEVHLHQFLQWCFGKSFENEKVREFRENKPKLTKRNQKQEKKKKITEAMNGLLKSKEIFEKLDQMIDSLRLNRVNVNDAIKYFSGRNLNGYFNKTQFFASLRGLLRKYECFDEEMEHHIDDSLSKFFSLFDSRCNGIIDIDEIALACSFLCKGTLGDKLKVMFEYFDEDLDDKISFEELVKYLNAMFGLVLKTLKDPELQFMDAKKLAEATARNCFSHLNIEEDQPLELNEFRKWCMCGVGGHKCQKKH